MIEKKQIFFLVFLDMIFAMAGVLLMLFLLYPLTPTSKAEVFDIILYAEDQNFQWHSFSYQGENYRQAKISLDELPVKISTWIKEEQRIPKMLWLLRKEDLDWQYRIRNFLQKTVSEQHHPQSPFHYELTFWPVASLADQQQRLKNWHEKQRPYP